MHRKVAQLAAVVVVATVVAQGVGASAMAPQVGGPERPIGAADDVYVQDNGDVVAVYDTPADGSEVNRTEFGVSTEENLAYFLMTDPVTGTPEVSGAFSAAATRSSLTSQGNVSMPSPPTMEALNLDLSGVRTSETSKFDMTVSTTLTAQSGMSQALQSATTNGSMTVTADRLTASGTFDATTGIPIPENAQQSLNATFRETDGGYVLSVDESRTVNPYNDVPRDEAAARESLMQRYGMMAQLLGGSASVELHSYSASEGTETVRMQQSYTVRLEGVEQGLQRMLRQRLQANGQVTDEQAEKLATALGEVEIEDVHVEYQITGEGASGSVDIDVRNYAPLATAYLDVAGSMQAGPSFDDQIERIRTVMEARRSADLEQTVTWSGSLTHPDQESIRAQFEVHSSSTNWAAYTSELKDRGVPIVDTRVGLQGDIEGDRLVFSGNASMNGENLYQELMRGLPNGSQMSGEAASMLTAFRESQPKKARFVSTYGDGGLRVEAAASFGNLSAIRDELRKQGAVPPISEVVGRINSSGGATYLRIPGALDGQPTRSDVRSLSYVDSETTIHMPGEWDRNFPSMNADRAREFLGAIESSGSGPGFGPIAAVVAIAGAALFLSRRD